MICSYKNWFFITVIQTYNVSLIFMTPYLIYSCQPMKHEALNKITFKYKITMYLEKLILFSLLKENFQKLWCIIQTQKDQ